MRGRSQHTQWLPNLVRAALTLRTDIPQTHNAILTTQLQTPERSRGSSPQLKGSSAPYPSQKTSTVLHLAKAHSILWDPFNPEHLLSELLPSGRPFRSIKARATRLKTVSMPEPYVHSILRKHEIRHGNSAITAECGHGILGVRGMFSLYKFQPFSNLSPFNYLLCLKVQSLKCKFHCTHTMKIKEFCF